MTLLRGYAENLPLQSWLNDAVWPFEAKMTAEDNYWATVLACIEMARYGCVSFSDMYYHTAERARAVVEAGTVGDHGHRNLLTCRPGRPTGHGSGARHGSYRRARHLQEDFVFFDLRLH